LEVCDIARAAAEAARWRPRSWAMDGAHEKVQREDIIEGIRGGGRKDISH
jgi:hypothetical protein